MINLYAWLDLTAISALTLMVFVAVLCWLLFDIRNDMRRIADSVDGTDHARQPLRMPLADTLLKARHDR
jgi:hypothetical protein